VINSIATAGAIVYFLKRKRPVTKEIQGLAGPANLQLLTLIDSGAFGSVWRGKYNGNYVAVSILANVKVKKISVVEGNKYRLAQMFLREAETMLLMKHKRVVEFIGTTVDNF
jgi:serine/threonine protein kinase